MSKVLAGRYELFERVGEGGMSVVYKAKDRLLSRFVAIKILKPEFINDHKFIESFRRESQNAASMSHPNIVNIYDVGREGNIHYIVMELIEGKTLSDYIKKDPNGMSYPKVITLSKQIASALSFAHKNHIIHRDVKPHNIMITPNGTAKITDFGIAKAVNAATIVDNTDGIVGSVHYFSPEQARGGYVDEKSDLYSLGIVMYEMLTGRVPFDGENPVNIALQHINEEMIPPSQVVSGVPPALEHIIMKCCDKYPVNRFASADELIEALNNLEFVNSVVGDGVLLGRGSSRPEAPAHGVPVAETVYNDYDDDEDEEYIYEGKRPAGKKGKSSKKTLGIVVAVAAVLLLAIIGAIFILGGEEIETPTFEGMTYEEAEELATNSDLKVKKGDEVISDTVDKGLVVSQDPEPGEMIKTGSTVTLNISKGRGDGSVPNLEGKMEGDLKKYLEAAGFELGKVTTSASDKPAGTVLSQSPSAGSELEKGSSVDVVVSDGSLAKVVVPGVVGKPQDEAEALIANAGLRYNVVKKEYTSGYKEGYVTAQSEVANTMVKKGTTITITVCVIPKPEPVDPEVPDGE